MLDDTFTPEGATTLDLGIDLDTVPEQAAVPAGEYQLTLVSAEIRDQKPEKGTGKFIQATFEVVDAPDSKLLNHIMMLPGKDDAPRKGQNRLRAIGDFFKAFGIPSSGPVNLDGYSGHTGWAILSVEDGGEYGEQNRVKRFIAGK
jgi:hypothetical protein